jgi:pimeloyl-ACP methyl ester carboxylesterase
MWNRSWWPIVLIIFFAVSNPQLSSALTLSPCHVRKVERTLQCGTFEVYEDRVAKQGRMIPLHIVVVPATGKNRAPDPLFWFTGGPGEAATNELELMLHDWSKINIHRDFVLVDVRGTGQSNGLECAEKEHQTGIQEQLDSFFPIKDVASCRKDLETHANLKLYTTSLAVDDLDDVRDALGYKKINISGGSYGTRFVQVYLRQHGNNVRTAILWSVLSTGARMPLSFAKDSQAALDALIAGCQKDSHCKDAFPDTTKEFSDLLTKLQNQPLEVEAKDSSMKANVKFRLTRDGLAQTVRYMLYSPASAAQIPLQIHLAAQGHFGPIAQSAHDNAQSIASSISDGYYLGVTCSEDIPFFSEAEANNAAANTFLGNFRSRVQMEACQHWVSNSVTPDFLEPVHSDVPSLLIGGDWDPVTPPHYMDLVSQSLSRSRKVLVHGGAHDFEGMKNSHCIDRVIESFLESADEKKIDMTCLPSMKPAPFALK